MKTHWPLEPENRALLGFAAIAIALLAILFGVSLIIESDGWALDGTILESIRSSTNGNGWFAHWLRSFMHDVTALGDKNILILIVAMVAGYLLKQGRSMLAASVALSLIIGGLLEVTLKHLFDRARPDVVAHLVDVNSASFPSGHAMDSAMVYLTLAALVSRAQKDPATRRYVLAVAFTITILVGISRLYLGVHWPTDVLAGWAFGSVWASICVFAARRLDRSQPS